MIVKYQQRKFEINLTLHCNHATVRHENYFNFLIMYVGLRRVCEALCLQYPDRKPTPDRKAEVYSTYIQYHFEIHST